MVEESDLFGLFRINWLKTQPDATALRRGDSRLLLT
jgi:hypothetical protein